MYRPEGSKSGFLLATPGAPKPRSSERNVSLGIVRVGSPLLSKMPISSRDLNALIARSPDFGAHTEPKRRAACLSALGYPSSVQVLGAVTLQVDGQPAIVLVLPGHQPDVIVGVTVAASCSSVATGLIADTTVRRP